MSTLYDRMAKLAAGRQYGDRDGLADSLLVWVERLSKDKGFPWPGTGLLADLKAAAAVINGEPEEPKKQDLEYDL